MDDIIEPTIDYDFSKIYLGPPSTLAGGAYFTRIMYNNNKLLYLQTPKCLTKQGFVKSGKKIFADLMFDNNDTVFINWIENLESKCQELIHNKGDAWFQTKLEKDDIETAFTSPFKIYKTGKYYLLRVNVKPNIKIYNETDTVIKIEDITPDKNIISILEIQGIKFTSRNFQIEIELKQSMVVSPDPFLDECFIKKPTKRSTPADNILTSNVTLATSASAIDTSTFSPVTINLENTDDGFDKNDETNVDNDNDDTNTLDEMNSSVLSNSLEDFIKDTANELNKPIETKDLEIHNESNTNNTNEFSNENLVLEIEELVDSYKKEDPNVLEEVDLSSSLVNSLESITLKKPNQVYYEIYKKARDKAKECKHAAIAAYLEAKNIKKTYMLDDNESDSDFDDDFDKYENDENDETF
jgi:serine/threonine protein kinase